MTSITNTPEQPQRHKWQTPKGIGSIAAALLTLGMLSACIEEPTDDTTTTTATTTEEVATETTTVEDTTIDQVPAEEPAPAAAADKSAEYEQWLKDQFGVDSFIEILIEDSTLWAGYVNGVEADGGLMHVRLQVDRSSEEGKDMGKRAAKAISSLIRTGNDPRVADVDWVVVEDGAGTYIAQESV